MEGFILHRLCCRAKKLARKWEGCYNIWSGIWRSDWRETLMELRFEKLKFYSAILLMWISFFLIATTFNTMWLFSRNIVVFVHNILFSTGSIFFLISCEFGHFIYRFLLRFFSNTFSWKLFFGWGGVLNPIDMRDLDLILIISFVMHFAGIEGHSFLWLEKFPVAFHSWLTIKIVHGNLSSFLRYYCFITLWARKS